MTEVLFYHLQHQPLEQALPVLLQKTLAKPWKAVVRFGSDERLKAIDDHLWTYQDDSFLPHGRDGEHASQQPIVLTTADDNPNQADVLFLVDRAGNEAAEGYARIVVMFDDRDGEALQDARALFKTMRDASHDVTYWQQDDRGGWQKKA